PAPRESAAARAESEPARMESASAWAAALSRASRARGTSSWACGWGTERIRQRPNRNEAANPGRMRCDGIGRRVTLPPERVVKALRSVLPGYHEAFSGMRSRLKAD